jgi:hypothetical protein
MQAGEYARYKNTGTVGKVVSSHIEGGVEWVELDNKLVYDASYLEPASADDYRVSSVKDRVEGLDLEQIEKLKEELFKAERHQYVTGGGGG